MPPEIAGGRFAAIVLAAGYSSRMGEFKPLLPLDGVSAFERSILLFREAGICDVIAVLGHRADELRPSAERCGAQPVDNPHFDAGMYSSIVAGVAAVPTNVDCAFMLPADIPLVRPETIRQLARAFTQQEAAIVYPVFEGRRGHPPLLARSILVEVIEGAPGPLSALLGQHESRAINVAVADQAIHMDMDTPADFAEQCGLAPRRDIPTRRECEAILAMGNVPRPVVLHSRKVADVALCLGFRLRGCGLDLNLELVQAGALLHDLAKEQPNHAAAGAAILGAMGFPRVGEIVAAHSNIPASFRLDETALVFLADKVVRGEQLVSLSQRFQAKRERFRNNDAALQAMQARLDIALAVARVVEARLEMDLFSALHKHFRVDGSRLGTPVVAGASGALEP